MSGFHVHPDVFERIACGIDDVADDLGTAAGDLRAARIDSSGFGLLTRWAADGTVEAVAEALQTLDRHVRVTRDYAGDLRDTSRDFGEVDRLVHDIFGGGA